MHRQAVRFGADRVVEKPLINDTLTYTVANVLHKSAAENYSSEH